MVVGEKERATIDGIVEKVEEYNPGADTGLVRRARTEFARGPTRVRSVSRASRT